MRENRLRRSLTRNLLAAGLLTLGLILPKAHAQVALTPSGTLSFTPLRPADERRGAVQQAPRAPTLQAAAVSAVATPPPRPAAAGASLVAAFKAARDYDPQFRTAIAERTVNETAATAARWAYLPELRYTSQQSELENASRNTFSITQPLISADRYYQFRERIPRDELAVSTFEQREQELAVRLMKAVSELVKAREALRANEFRINASGEQAKRAERMLQLAEGTVTDKYDAEVKLAQARGNEISLRARLRVAENQYASIVGVPPTASQFIVAAAPQQVPLDALNDYLTAGSNTNPLLRTARQQEQLADLGASRAKAALLPQVGVSFVNTSIDGRSNQYAGISLSMPLGAQNATNIYSARAQAEQARERTRDAEQKLKFEIERLRALVEAGQQEWAIRRQTMEAAQVSVNANLKSQQGGVRTVVDVLNSVQTLADVRNDYATTVTNLAENYLNLLLQAAVPAAEALQKVQSALFEG